MSLVTNVGNLATRVATEFKTIRTLITGSGTGTLAGLTTTDKTSVVAAINEVKASAGTPADASTTVKGIVELATTAEAQSGTDTVRAVTPAGLAAVKADVKAEILGAGVPSALDTLDELAAALGDDANFAATTATALGNRVRVDTASQGLNGTQQANARANIGAGTSSLAIGTTAGTAADAAAVGDTTTDFVATFVAGLA